MSDRLRIIVTGLIAQYPLGGVTWDYIQYVAGLARLGHDVYYIEDTGQWPYNPDEAGIAKDCAYNVRYLADVMAQFDRQSAGHTASPGNRSGSGSRTHGARTSLTPPIS